MKYYVEYLGRTIADEYGNKVDTKIVNQYIADMRNEEVRYKQATEPLDTAKDIINAFDEAAATIAMEANSIVSENTDDKAYIFADLYAHNMHYIEYDSNVDVILTEANANKYGIKPSFIRAFNYVTNRQAEEYDTYESAYKMIEESIEDEHRAKTADITNKYMEEIPMPSTNNRVDEDGIIWNNPKDAEYALLHYTLGNYKPNLNIYFD